MFRVSVKRQCAAVAMILTLAGCGSSSAPVASPLQTAQPTPMPTAAATLTPPSEAPTPTAAPTPLTTIDLPADDGTSIVKVTTVDVRTRDLLIKSPALGLPPTTPPHDQLVTVRLLLPSQFDAQPAARWPVLYLLCGFGGDHKEWTLNTDVENLTAPTDLLVVMPDAGGGWYSDWWNGGKGGPPEWETFHLTELRQLLERNWRAGDKRAIAGLSMGGYGAMEYAARRPGMFLAAASFSGVLDPVAAQARGWRLGAPDVMWGDPVAQADVWKAHDPTDNVAALKGTALYVAHGNGQPGPLDASGAMPDSQESEFATESAAFVHHLDALKIPVTVYAYGNGTHDWPYWQRDLHRWLPLALKALAG
jgi:diacylglycerol O-acyltransferase / trehalose O-mycolyltransferase